METEVINERIMRTITSSSPHVFNSAETESISMIALSENKTLIAFSDEGNQHRGTVIIATIDRGIITYSPKYVFGKAGTWSISAVALSETSVLIAYTEGLKGFGTVIHAAISGDEVVYSLQRIFNDESTYFPVIIALSENKALILYSDSRDNLIAGRAAHVTITDDGIVQGWIRVFSYAYAWRISAAALSSNQMLIAFTDSSNSYHGTAVLATISGSEVCTSSHEIFAGEGTEYLSATVISENHVLLAFKDGVSGHGTVILATISENNSIFYSSPHVFNNAYTSYITVTRLSKTQALITYEDSGDGFSGTAVIVTVSEDTISTSQEHVFSKAGAGNVAAVPLSKTNVLIAYAAGGEEYGTAVLVTVSGRDTRRKKKTASLKVKRKRK